jgi:hypothetical protein
MNGAPITYFYSDLESNPMVVSVQDETASGTPPYIVITSSSITIKAANVNTPGSHLVKVVLSDGLMNSTYSLGISFGSSAPFFTGPLTDLSVVNG